jgi:hypothetical protein
MRVHFVLVCEGRSDEGLVPHIERLLITEGVSEVTGTAPDFGMIPHQGRTVFDKLRTAIQLEASANLIIIHRDADIRDPEPRYREIALAVERLRLETPWVAIVPVQETEAWLLLDETAIRSVAGNPNGRVELALPPPARAERIVNPKEFLENTLVVASELTGRRVVRFRNSLAAKRKQLLEQLPVGGRLERVESWMRFRRELAAVVSRLA